MNLVDNWTSAWKWISMQSMAGIATINATYAMLPADVSAHVPPIYIHWATVILSGCAMFGRLIQQSPQPPVSQDNVSK